MPFSLYFCLYAAFMNGRFLVTSGEIPGYTSQASPCLCVCFHLSGTPNRRWLALDCIPTPCMPSPGAVCDQLTAEQARHARPMPHTGLRMDRDRGQQVHRVFPGESQDASFQKSKALRLPPVSKLFKFDNLNLFHYKFQNLRPKTHHMGSGRNIYTDNMSTTQVPEIEPH